MKRKIICIVGPTASGKTFMAVWLAKKIGGEIISADSRQVYRKLDIGTGKEGLTKELGIRNNLPAVLSAQPIQAGELGIKAQDSKSEQIKQNAKYIDDIPQYMIDVVEPKERFTLFDWLDGARLIIEDIFSRGKTPIVVGGTGLYVQALAEGFGLEVKSEKLKVKSYSREDLNKKSLEQLQKIYSKFKIRNYKIDLNNPHRLIRTIELVQEGIIPSKKKPDFEVLQIGVSLEREKLYEKIDRRVDEWFEQGFLKEVQGLLNSGVSPEWLRTIGLEYRILANFLIDSRFRSSSLSNEAQASESNDGNDKKKDGDDKEKSGNDKESSENNKNGDDFEKMKQEMKFAIHHYARRQMTWFRRFPEIKWVNNKQEALEIAKDFLE